MPFKSTAQQRYMYSQHPEIASRWTEEMRQSRRKGAKEHPIKSANLPSHVGKRMTGGSFTSGPSAIVRGSARTTARRNTVGRYGGHTVHGSRKAEPGLEVYRSSSRSRVAKAFTPTNMLSALKDTGKDIATGMNIARDSRQGMLIPSGKPTMGNKIGQAVGSATATPGKTAATVGTAATIGAAGGAAMTPKKQVGQRGPADLSKADTMSVRLHGASGRSYDPEGRRQRRLGAAMAASAGGGAAATAAGGKHLRDLNREAKVTARTGASTGVKHTGAVSRRGAVLVGGGIAGLAAANRIRRYANDPSNRKWD